MKNSPEWKDKEYACTYINFILKHTQVQKHWVNMRWSWERWSHQIVPTIVKDICIVRKGWFETISHLCSHQLHKKKFIKRRNCICCVCWWHGVCKASEESILDIRIHQNYTVFQDAIMMHFTTWPSQFLFMVALMIFKSDV